MKWGDIEKGDSLLSSENDGSWLVIDVEPSSWVGKKKFSFVNLTTGLPYWEHITLDMSLSGFFVVYKTKETT